MWRNNQSRTKRHIGEKMNLQVSCICRECKRKFSNEYYEISICPECWEKFNTPQVQKEREEYQKREAERYKQYQEGEITYQEYLNKRENDD